MSRLLIALFVVCLATEADACTIHKRKASQARLFRKTHICPATNKIETSCPGYVVDHIKPRCAGGADRPYNMQYQALLESYKKDVQERALCKKLRAMKDPIK